MIPPDERARRCAVWQAMSDFFLDTELDEAALRSAAAVLRDSQYSRAQLEAILRTEVAPLLYFNLCLLYTVAGVWDGFDVNWIEQQVIGGKHRDIQKWYKFVDRWLCDSVVRGVERQYWVRVTAYLSEPTLTA